MKLKEHSISIAIISLILTTAITLQLRTMAKTDSFVTKTFANDDLKDELLLWEEKYETITKELERTSKELKDVRTEKTENDESSKEKSEQIKKNNMLLGLTDVIGNGVIITAKDAQGSILSDKDSLVHDEDLRGIVSELTNAGAEAISINDERIVNTTCITCAGNVISINDQKVTSPFVIKAIGNPELLYGIDRPGGYLDLMREEYFIPVEIKKANNIEIKKYNSAFTTKFIKNLR